jgi:dinuclear metal center YbgI/SA1388 family protein
MSKDKLRIQDITSSMDDFAPPRLAENWDTVGLQIGEPERLCQTVCLALDLTRNTLDEAIAHGADLIITHHPLLLRPPQSIRFDQPLGNLIQRLCAENISLYAVHTNLDSTAGGLNDHLAKIVGIEVTRSLSPPPISALNISHDKVVGLGRVGHLKKTESLKHLANRLHESLNPAALRVIGDNDREVTTVALCTGSGGSLVQEAIASGADCFVTGDIKYHQALDARAVGMAIIDVGHYATEIASISILKSVLTTRFGSDLKIIPLKAAADPLRAYIA